MAMLSLVKLVKSVGNEFKIEDYQSDLMEIFDKQIQLKSSPSVFWTTVEVFCFFNSQGKLLEEFRHSLFY